MVEAELPTHAQPTTAKLGAGRSASVRAEFLRITRETMRAWCARTMSFVRFCLSVGGQIAISQVVVGQTLVPHDAGAVENRQGETWESAHVDLVGRQACRRADGIAVSEFDVRKMQVPNVLLLVDDHSQHLGHSVVHPLNSPVTVGMIGACSKLAHAQQLICSL